jgi:hypothetical protein
MISPDSEGPIMIYRNLDNVVAANRLLKKVGVKLPDNAATTPSNNETIPKKTKHRYYKKKKHYHQ